MTLNNPNYNDSMADARIALHTAVDTAHHVRELWVPCTYASAMGAYGLWPVGILANLNDVGYVSFRVLEDWTAIVAAELIVIPRATQATANWDIGCTYSLVGEAYNLNFEQDVASTYNVVDGTLFAIDISGIMTGIAINDNVAIRLTESTAGHNVNLIGARFKIT